MLVKSICIHSCNNTLPSLGHTHRLAWYVAGMFLRNAIISSQVLLLGRLDGCTVFQLMTQLRMEAMFIGNVLNGAHLILGIHVGEGAAYNARAVGYLCMLSIHMTRRTSRLVAKHIRTSRRMWLWSGRQMKMRNIRAAGAQCTNDLDTINRKCSCYCPVAATFVYRLPI